MSLKVGENVVRVSNSLDPDETPSYSASHLDQSCLHIINGTLVVIGGLRVKNFKNVFKKNFFIIVLLLFYNHEAM